MALVGKNPNQRLRVSVELSPPVDTPIATTTAPSPQQVAAYIAEICLELVLMAKGANLTLVAHLLAMAQAEAEYAAESVV